MMIGVRFMSYVIFVVVVAVSAGPNLYMLLRHFEFFVVDDVPAIAVAVVLSLLLQL